MFNKNHMATLVATAGLLFVSTAANAIRRCANVGALSIQRNAHSAFFFTHGTVSIALKRRAFSARR